MAYPVELASVLSGASVYQLRRWRHTGLLMPEMFVDGHHLYSFRDVAVLRTVVRLRVDASLQKIRTAFQRLPEYDLDEHPSVYRFATDGKTVRVWTDDGFMDLVDSPGQFELLSFDDVSAPFTTKTGAHVVDFKRPRPRLRVDEHKRGGWPTIAGTRIDYDIIAQVVDGQEITVDDVDRYYPGVSAEAALDALDFDREVAEHRPKKKAA